MGVAKVVLNGDTLIDTTSKTVAADKMLAAYTALDKAGDNVTGNIATKTSSDLTVSGATVTAPAGFYASNVSKSVSSMTLPTSASTTSSGTSKATISRSTSDQYINIPTGYNSAASYYKISAVANGSATPAASISATGATITTGTNTLTLSKTVSNTPQVSAGYVSAGTAGNSSVSLTATVNIRSSSDLTASGATVTAPAGYYASAASKSVSSMTLPTYSSSISSGTQAAIIGRSANDLYINIPTGYNSTASYYKISAVPNGTAGTPTATKGTVSNHQVSITPSVTNTTGYITGSTKTGTAVTVTASELASGNKEITSNGTGIDVVGYSTVSVDVTTSAEYTATISGIGNASSAYVQLNGGTKYYTDGSKFKFHAGDELYTYVSGSTSSEIGFGIYSAPTVLEHADGSPVNYTWTLPHNNITIILSANAEAYAYFNSNTYNIADMFDPYVLVDGYTFVNFRNKRALAYETGTWSPTSDVEQASISFSYEHSDPPKIVIMIDNTSAANTNTKTNLVFVLINYSATLEYAKVHPTTSSYEYGMAWSRYTNTSSTTLSNSSLGFTSTNISAYATSTGITPKNVSATGIYWRSGRTYKWMALW